MSKVFSVRVDDDLAAWVEEQARATGKRPGTWVKDLLAVSRSGPEVSGRVQAVRPQGPSRVERAEAAAPGLQRATSLVKDEDYFAQVTAWNRKHGPGAAA